MDAKKMDAIKEKKKLTILINMFDAILKHYVIIASVFVMLASVACYLYVTSVFHEVGLNYFDFLDLSDIYSVALSKGIIRTVFVIVTLSVAFVVVLAACVLCSIIYIGDKIDTLEPERVKQIILLVFMLSFLVFIFAMKQIAGENEKEQSLSERFKYDSRYQLLTSEKQAEQSCVAIFATSSDNYITYNYKQNTIEIVPKSKVNRIDLIEKSFPSYSVRYPKRGASNNERVAYLEDIKNSQLEWIARVNSKCMQNISLDNHIQNAIDMISDKN